MKTGTQVIPMQYHKGFRIYVDISEDNRYSARGETDDEGIKGVVYGDTKDTPQEAIADVELWIDTYHG